MSEFLKCCRPYSQECALRKVHMRMISHALLRCLCLALQILADKLAEHVGCLPQHRLQASYEQTYRALYWQSAWPIFTNYRMCLIERLLHIMPCYESNASFFLICCRGQQPDFSEWFHFMDLMKTAAKERLGAKE
jgi:hypothetical protein